MDWRLKTSSCDVHHDIELKISKFESKYARNSLFGQIAHWWVVRTFYYLFRLRSQMRQVRYGGNLLFDIKQRKATTCKLKLLKSNTVVLLSESEI